MGEKSRRAGAYRSVALLGSLAGLAFAAAAAGQARAQAPQPAFLTDAYPDRKTDPEAVARGRELYFAYGCSFCHGEDTRGGQGGPSLLRSQRVQRDRAGETIGPIIRNGVADTAMVGFALEPTQIADIAEFLHSFELDSRDPARQRPESIVTGNARAGRRYFDDHCAACHSVSGDLRGIAGRYESVVDLQTNWLMPRDPPPTRVRVTARDGSVVAGRLVRIDEFLVSLELPDGRQRSFRRDGDDPLVAVDDPLAGHKDLLPRYEDRDIHDVTAYLVTLD